jgi:hypothetical protein
VVLCSVRGNSKRGRQQLQSGTKKATVTYVAHNIRVGERPMCSILTAPSVVTVLSGIAFSVQLVPWEEAGYFEVVWLRVLGSPNVETRTRYFPKLTRSLALRLAVDSNLAIGQPLRQPFPDSCRSSKSRKKCVRIFLVPGI